MLPNILICGTPGTGKSTIGEMLSTEVGYRIIDVGKFAKENGHLRLVHNLTNVFELNIFLIANTTMKGNVTY